MGPSALITLKGVGVRVSDRRVLKEIDWRIHTGENWVIRGPNGAGKTTLAKTLAGHTAIVAGRMWWHGDRPPEGADSSTNTVIPAEAADTGAAVAPDAANRAGANTAAVAFVCPEDFHHLHAREQKWAEMRAFSGRIHEVTSAAQALELDPSGRDCPVHLLPRFNALAAKPLRALSSGELRELLIIRALTVTPQLLVLDEPFNNLDTEAQDRLLCLLERHHRSGGQTVLVAHHDSDIPDFFTHILLLENGRIAYQGPITNRPADHAARSAAVGDGSETPEPIRDRRYEYGQTDSSNGDIIIGMDNVTVAHNDIIVLDRVTWTVRMGENWAVTGPNGAGKTTLLKLVTGENLQGFANKLTLFGRPRGSGETLWQIRRHIGYVADDLQAHYQRSLTGVDVVCSGFFDSVGLYSAVNDLQRKTALAWLEKLDIAEPAQRLFTRLSHGQQRLLLIARAMVKQPRLLVLDEPCNGLDSLHREKVLAALDRIAAENRTQLLYVTHRRQDMPRCIGHCLVLNSGRVVAIKDNY